MNGHLTVAPCLVNTEYSNSLLGIRVLRIPNLLRKGVRMNK